MGSQEKLRGHDGTEPALKVGPVQSGYWEGDWQLSPAVEMKGQGLWEVLSLAGTREGIVDIQDDLRVGGDLSLKQR